MVANSDGGGGGSTQPDRNSVTFQGGNYGGIYVPGVTVTSDNVDKSSVPSQFATKPGDPGTKTEWDASTLDGAITWLNAHADTLKRMYHGMDTLKKLMDGPGVSNDVTQHSGLGGRAAGPLGGFPWAAKLAERHTNLFQSYNTELKKVVENLYDAADALKKVKDKYHDVEHANVMTAADMETDFTDAQSIGHNI